MTTTDPLALESQVCFQAVVAARSVVAVYRPILEPLGLTHPQYLVMLALWERNDRSISDLGAALQLEPATLTPLLKRLQGAGFVGRARSTVDERVVVVSLTDAGRELRGRAVHVPAQAAARTGLSIAELEALRDALDDVVGRLNGAAAEADAGCGRGDGAGGEDDRAA
ncbi:MULTISPECIES: MarR family winged helix-turn-helix transcriptional regulator [Clavibacter]|uniref:MarR family transcriptional regulator n=1 Tax=Clavibacter tessellarius TaxID=31965 RepID=A0A154UYR7_9MICO|nr:MULTISPECIES: MarR family transcriptional regulator [Clavibacter]KZC94226.1 MarR family transcriptional regulator [Clavibacter michiganensis subsp. tessellarius]MDA3804209.1 MarR family transcriptional regulator [Clavibacter sp. CT19]